MNKMMTFYNRTLTHWFQCGADDVVCEREHVVAAIGDFVAQISARRTAVTRQLKITNESNQIQKKHTHTQ